MRLQIPCTMHIWMTCLTLSNESTYRRDMEDETRCTKELGMKYANVTRDVVELFKSLCVECMKKRKRMATKGVVVRLILTGDYGSRGQVDLVDMQSMPNGQFKWIMVYQDHLTKFCVLRSLTSKRACEVGFQLLDIFLLLGAPHILQSDNGCEFTAAVITELKIMWPDLRMVHGKPRHPQSQGSVERLNCDIKDMLIAWLGDNGSTDWPTGLKFVQFSKNSSYHSGIKQSPYKALFSDEPRVGIRSTPLPTEILDRMETESDLYAALQGPAMSVDPSTSAAIDPSTSLPATSASFNPSTSPTTSAAIDPSSSPHTTSAAIDTSTATLTSAPTASGSADTEMDNHQKLIAVQRKRAREGGLEQAERMIKRSRIEHVAGNLGDNVTIPIPLVDCGRGDPRNILGVIVDRDEKDLYRIAVRAGLLHGKYSRNQFDLCTQKLLAAEDVCQETEIALRAAVQAESKCGARGLLNVTV